MSSVPVALDFRQVSSFSRGEVIWMTLGLPPHARSEDKMSRIPKTTLEITGQKILAFFVNQPVLKSPMRLLRGRRNHI